VQSRERLRQGQTAEGHHAVADAVKYELKKHGKGG
jgi:hypothetical protein